MATLKTKPRTTAKKQQAIREERAFKVATGTLLALVIALVVVLLVQQADLKRGNKELESRLRGEVYGLESSIDDLRACTDDLVGAIQDLEVYGSAASPWNC